MTKIPENDRLRVLFPDATSASPDPISSKGIWVCTTMELSKGGGVPKRKLKKWSKRNDWSRVLLHVMCSAIQTG